MEKNCIESADLYFYPVITKSFKHGIFGVPLKDEGLSCKIDLQMNTILCKQCKKSYANKVEFRVTCQLFLIKIKLDCSKSIKCKISFSRGKVPE